MIIQQKREGCFLSAKERVLAIRLWEKTLKNPAYAKAVGIEAGMTKNHVGSKTGW